MIIKWKTAQGRNRILRGISFFLLSGLAIPPSPSHLFAADVEKELQLIEKTQQKDQKKLKESNLPILPAGEESAAEKLRRKEEAEERLKYFKEDLEKRRTPSEGEGLKSNPSPSDGVRLTREVRIRSVQEALQKKAPQSQEATSVMAPVEMKPKSEKEIRKEEKQREKALKRMREEEEKKEKALRKAINERISKAQESIQKKNYSFARVKLSEALKIAPQNEIASNLMAIAVEGEFIADQHKKDGNQVIAHRIEENQMRERFDLLMAGIDSDIQRLTQEGNELYQQGDFVKANQKYQEVMKLQATRQPIAENLYRFLRKRDEKPIEVLTTAEIQVRTELFLKEAEILEQQGDWDGAAERYESIFLMDPLNKTASTAMDQMKKRFITAEKKKIEQATQAVEGDFQSRLNFYIEEALKARDKGDREQAKILIEQALSLDSRNHKAQDILRGLQKEELERKL